MTHSFHASHSQFEERREACRKTVYPDAKAARSQINLSLRRRKNRPKHLRAYWCEECRGWHLTHK